MNITLDISPLGVLMDELLYQLCLINRDMLHLRELR
jgi:hypothetical protein